MKFLWLGSWYPSRLSPFDGDFIKRHAQAVSLYDYVDVLYVERDKEGTVTKTELIENSRQGNLNETIVYYYLPQKRSTFLNTVISAYKYINYYKRAIKKYIKIEGKPDLVHLHVSIKAGLLARWIKGRYKINYVLTEHWTGFLPEARAEFNQLPFYLRQQCLTTIRGASAVSTVSEYLASQLNKITGSKSPIVVPNVVDTGIFFPEAVKRSEVVRFLHISSLGYQKNPEDILKAFAIVMQHHTNFRLEIFGPESKSLLHMSASLNLQNHIYFNREIPQEDLVKYYRKSDALILYSRYETFGCVIIEANACGLPVIVSDIPVMYETVKPYFNGLIVEKESPRVLAETLIAFIEGKYSFDEGKISEFTQRKYCYESVGNQFHNWYKDEK